MRRPRPRPTFLTRIVAMCVSLSLFAAAVAVLGRQGGVWSLVFLLVFWVLGLELGMLPGLLERLLARMPEVPRASAGNPWFTDPDDAKRVREESRVVAQENPTLR